MTLAEEKRYLLLLASYYCGTKQQNPTQDQVLECIEKRNWAIFSANELQCTAEEAVWKGEATVIYQSMLTEKLYEEGSAWILSGAGKEELARLHQVVASSFPVKVSYPAIEYAESVFPFA